MATIASLTDPCQRATDLRALRDKLISGGAVIEAEFEQGNGNRRRAKYAPADLARLDREITAAENACTIAGGGRPRRFAIGGRV